MNNLFILLLGLPLSSVHLQILVYIDPGTGSIIVQALVATVVGAGVAIRLFRQRILKFFGFRKEIDSDPSEKESDTEN